MMIGISTRSTAIFICSILFLSACGGSGGSSVDIAEETARSIAECGPHIEYTKGTLPIILTNPHGASPEDPNINIANVPIRRGANYAGTGSNFTTVTDLNTDIATDTVANRIEMITGERPYVIKARFPRTQIDAGRVAPNAVNRFESIERNINLAYENSLAKSCYDAFYYAVYESVSEVRDIHGRGTIIDIHSARNVLEASLTRGIRNGESVQELIDIKGDEAVYGPNSLFGLIAARGVLTDPANPADADNQRYLGSFVTQRWGTDIAYRWGIAGINTIDTIQIEISKVITEDSEPSVLENTMNLLGEALVEYYDIWYND